MDSHIGAGHCVHGRAIVWLDRTVEFLEDCTECARVLRTEEFIVREPARAG